MRVRFGWPTLGRVFTVALLVVTSATCRSGAGEPAKPGRFTRDDLDAIVLQPSDAPLATAYVDGVSGYKTLRSFARDDEELGHLKEDGFQTGHLVLFLPADRVNASGPTAPLTNNSVIVQGITGLFRDAVGADRSLERYVQDLRTRQIPDASEIEADGLGDRSWGLQGVTPDGSKVLVFAWRVDNVILVVSGSGPLPAVEIRALADLVNARAS
ncbi:MAG: hypothetical protein ABI595_12120 [Actinomycetota bacterium]